MTETMVNFLNQYGELMANALRRMGRLNTSADVPSDLRAITRSLTRAWLTAQEFMTSGRIPDPTSWSYDELIEGLKDLPDNLYPQPVEHKGDAHFGGTKGTPIAKQDLIELMRKVKDLPQNTSIPAALLDEIKAAARMIVDRVTPGHVFAFSNDSVFMCVFESKDGIQWKVDVLQLAREDPGPRPPKSGVRVQIEGRSYIASKVEVDTQSPNTGTAEDESRQSFFSTLKHVDFYLADAPLGPTERGLVVSVPAVAEPASSSLTIQNQLDRQELRFSLLFWDRLDFPENNTMGPVGSSADVQFLENAGVLQRSKADDPFGGEMAETFLKAHLGVFYALDRREPGRWSLGRGERSVTFHIPELVPDRGLLFELHYAVPVPDRDVPLADVLEFRRKRRAELLAMRAHLEELFQKVIASPDRPLAGATELARLDQALKEQIQVSKGFGIRCALGSLQAKLDWKAVPAGTAAFAALSEYGLPLTQALMGGFVAGLTSTLNVTATFGTKGRSTSSSPYEYVSKFHRDLF